MLTLVVDTGISVIVIIGLGLLALIPAGTSVEDDGDEVRGYYLGGGSAFGVTLVCLKDRPDPYPKEWNVDIGGACDLRCPEKTCDISVIDDHHGNNVGFRVCFEGEAFCRQEGYWKIASVPGEIVTVAITLEHATRGVVIVR